MEHDLEKIFGHFVTGAEFLEGGLYGSGHIHDTYRILTKGGETDDFILQKLNSRIFKDIPRLQENIERVTLHLRNKLRSIPGSDIKRECLTLIPTTGNMSWLNDGEGNYWRLYIFITRHRSYNLVDSAGKAFEGGKAIGRFQAMLADLPGKPLHETIPAFHDIEKRLETLKETMKRDRVGRAAGVRAETDKILSLEEAMKIILKLGRAGKIPLRITHNDTKFNNILLDENDRALCVIDLDTVMPGYVHYDFGDAIRTAANRAQEDEKDLSKVGMDINLFEAYASGYLSETRDTLNETEKEYLAFSPLLITYTIAVRFLTDYIDGDNYFKIHHEHHNLQRARAQLRLVESMNEQYHQMQEIIRVILSR
ncbi:MAG TPA: aminoglycoside phosphotransferase family protein [Bacteroidales bacterium]|nr:aminoglycoside phosphotransferase family protein [Bacteroidales bacterium]HPF03123.1 aminoglycoside phosphotransferase family protein [Bacteroidales bacterium]HPJ58561.1 aminoglycoside phosphotransferase family protein [Bacteroidales bacterium]HPR11280.1 aminoglycoside phosphotransferase family protein [Bacteroidales bacterium]HRW86373.1 aminoglycoside phosphotransferase family protein [Bacteroidales bacterium]